MSPQRIATTIRRQVPLLHDNEPLRDAVTKILKANTPALPVIDANAILRGIFGEREFIGALFPGYLTTLGYAGFIPRSLDDALQKRPTCASEPVRKYMNTEHVDVDEEHSDIQLAEIFLHHRVLIIPITNAGKVTGIVTRADFFRAVAQRMLDLS